jgi:hypothetical protein
MITSPIHKIILTMIAFGVVAGCSHKPAIVKADASPEPLSSGNVSAREVTSASAVRYEAEPGIEYKSPRPYPSNLLPIYPEKLLASNLPPITVTARIIVNDEGKVTDVSNLNNSTDAPEEFFLSTRTSLLQWEFIPLFRVTGFGNEPMPFHLDYSFTFTQVDGKPVIKAN